jgi:hypothetical protein
VHKKPEEGKERIPHSLTSRQSSDKTAMTLYVKSRQERKKERKQAASAAKGGLKRGGGSA